MYMYSPIYWIPESRCGRLAIAPRPRGGDWLDDEISGWKSAGVGAVLSLLTSAESSELLLGAEGDCCRSRGIVWISFPIVDRGVPGCSFGLEVSECIAQVDGLLRQGQGVLIHCRMGIGRSALLAAAVLVTQGLDVEEAFSAIERARGVSVPDTGEQRAWVQRFAGERAPARV